MHIDVVIFPNILKKGNQDNVWGIWVVNSGHGLLQIWVLVVHYLKYVH